MVTGTSPALSAVRITLLAGVSAAALSFAAGTANAQQAIQTRNAGGVLPGTATATGANSTAVGSAAAANGSGTTAVGANSYAGTDSVNSNPGTNATALGSTSFATGNNSIAVGNQPNPNTGAFGNGSIGIGTNVQAGAEVPFGGANAIAIGTNASANNGGGPFGNGPGSLNTNAIAIGANTSAQGNNSVAIGAGAVSNTDNLIVLGATGTTTQVQKLNVQNGATITGGAVVNNGLTANGGSTLNGGAIVNGLLKANNGVAVTGNTTTDSLTVNNNATIGGTLGVTGVANLNGGMNVTGTSTFIGTGPTNAGTTTTINGATATLNGSQGTITLNANVDPVVTISNTASTSFTRVNNGFVNVVGGPTANTGNVNTLTSSNAAVNVTGGAVINNGLQVNDGLRVTGPSQGLPPQTIDMGGNRVQDVATPIFGTDAANKAYVDRGLNKAFEGTAIALAISQPIIGPNQTFAIRAGWGTYESENAFGLSAAGIIGRDWFWNGSTLALDGGVGWGSNNSVAGKAGVTLAFGGGTPPVLPLK